MKYDGDLATIQRRVAATSDMSRRRLAVLDAIALRPGERVLEVGCGGGALLPPMAAAVGPTGRVVGIDVSADQIAAAQALCAGIGTAQVAVQDVHEMPFEDASFDAIAAIQVVEYLRAPPRALAELRRVAAPGARCAILATNWDTVFWNTDAPDLNARLQAAWRQHAPIVNLPAELPSMLAAAGFDVVRQEPVTIINAAYHEDSFAFWAARIIVAFGTARDLVPRADAEAWLDSLGRMQEAGRFFFSSTPVLTTAVAA